MARQTLILARNISEANRYAKVVGLPRFTYRAVRNAGAIRGVRSAEVHILSSFARRLDRHQILSALRWAKLDVYYVVFEDGKILDGTEDDARFEVAGDGTVSEIDPFPDFKQRHIAGVAHEPDVSDFLRYESILTEQLELVGDDRQAREKLEAALANNERARKRLEALDERGVPSERDLEVAYRYDRLRDLEAAEFRAAYDAAHEKHGEIIDAIVEPKPERRTRRRRCSTGEHLVEADELEAHNAEHDAPAPVPAIQW